MVTLDIWSDIVCPWCFIGKRRLERALALGGEQVKLRWRAYELQPDLPREGVDARALYLSKFGSEERMKQIFARTAEAAAGDGLHFVHEKLERVPNTFLAHQVVKAAREQGRDTEVLNALFTAHHEHARFIGTLDDIVKWLGEQKLALDFGQLRERVESGAFADEVREDEAKARELGVSGVPFFLANGRVALSGAGAPEDLARLIAAGAAQPSV